MWHHLPLGFFSPLPHSHNKVLRTDSHTFYCERFTCPSIPRKATDFLRPTPAPTMIAQSVKGIAIGLRTWLHLFKVKLWLALWLTALVSGMCVAPALLYKYPLIPIVVYAAVLDICLINGYLLLKYEGFVKLHSATHVPFLLGIVPYLFLRLASDVGGGMVVGWERGLLWWITACMTGCLAFDLYDTYMWFVRGHREVIKAPSTGEVVGGGEVELQ